MQLPPTAEQGDMYPGYDIFKSSFLVVQYWLTVRLINIYNGMRIEENRIQIGPK